MCKIEYKLIELIVLFEYLVFVENLDSYKRILSQYKKVYENIQSKEVSEIAQEDFTPLTNTFRLYFEAIPSDDKLGEYIANKMHSFYEEMREYYQL